VLYSVESYGDMICELDSVCGFS